MNNFYKSNRLKLKQLLRSEQVDLIVVAGNSFLQASADRTFSFQQDSNFFYLTGINEPGIVLVSDGNDEYLIVPERSDSRIVFEGEIDTHELSKVSGISKIVSGKQGWEKLEKRINKSQKIGSLLGSGEYIESIDMFTNPGRQYLIGQIKKLNANIDIIDLRQHFTSLRMIKSDYEIQMIEKAIQKTHSLFEGIEKQRNDAKNERDLHAEAVKRSILLESEFAYAPIIASGKNAFTLHYEKNNSPIKKGDMLLLDLGLKHAGYSADITRTLLTDPTERQKEVYAAVLAVKDYATSLLKPGVLMKDYELEVCSFMGLKLVELGLIKTLTKDDVRKYYPHSTSHFLGLDVHDVGDYKRPLEPGMVLTVEPGIYIPEENIGVRIEDDILITADGNRNLSYN